MAIRRYNLIDKLEIRLPWQASLTEAVRAILTRPTVRVKQTKYYRRVIDLRPYGFSSMLHYASRQTGDHKLELEGVGEMALSAILAEISAVINENPYELKIMRVDLAADVLGYSVEWFRENTRIAYTRCSREIMENDQGVKTLYRGRRPNLFRFYDKCALRQIEYGNLVARGRLPHLPSFEDLYGHSPDATVTRVERQCGGGRVPPQIDTVGNLAQNATTFNPFSTLQIRPGTGASEAIADEYQGGDFFKAQALLRLIERNGWDDARRIVHRKTSGNAHRFFKRVKKMILGTGEVENLDVYAVYRCSVTEQLVGAGRWVHSVHDRRSVLETEVNICS